MPPAAASSSAHSPLPRTRPRDETIVLALMLLLGTQPISTDLYLPSLPSLPGLFGVPIATVQLTLSVLVISFGAAQLLLGPVADRLGSADWCSTPWPARSRCLRPRSAG